MRAAAYIDRL